MRGMWLFLVLAMALIFPVTVQAQGPTPPTPTPSIVQVCLDEKLGTCVARVASEFGTLAVILAILVVAVLVPPIRKKLQEGVEAVISTNPFAWKSGLRRYLKAFIAQNRVFGFRGMETFTLKPIDLTNAYIQLDLDFSKLAEKEGRAKVREDLPEKVFGGPGEKKNFQLAQILQAGYKKIVIIGDAGSGKSALLQWAGMTVAQGKLSGKLSREQQEFLKAVGFNNLFRSFVPLLVPLRKYHSHCLENKLPIDANSLYAFICEYAQREYRKENLPEDLFRKLLRKGCLVMFDGVDEVEFANRPNVRAAVEGVIADDRNASRNLYLITTRPSAAEVTSQLMDFETAIVQPLTPEKRASIVELWCNAVYPTLTMADDKAQDLLRRIESPLVNEMATTPLMVNIFALVYYHRRDLPSQRAELFEQAVKALLTDPHKQGQAISDTSDWGGRTANQRFDDMALIAFLLHDENKDSVFADELISKEVFWKRFGSERESAQQKAAEFLDLVARRGGLLRQDGKSYDFYIRRFREFLAGHYVAQKMEEQWMDVIHKHVHQDGDQWIEPLLLAVGFLSYTNDSKAKKFMQCLTDTNKISDQHDHALTIAGIALADILKNPTEQVKSLFIAEKERLPVVLREILEKNPPALTVQLRRRLGLALGEIGDPRFPISFRNEVKVVLPDMVSVPAGLFRMGTSEIDETVLKEQSAQGWDDEKPSHDVLLSEYAIGKYPVTNAEYACFVEQGGYDPKADWWSEDGRKWRTGQWDSDLSWLPDDEDLRKQYQDWLAGRPVELRDRPFWWDDPEWSAANLPCVGISWFEAKAYCNWLSSMTKKHFRLPTEAEWENAARGPNGFLWAWGNVWDSEKANTDEDGKKIGGTSTVGMYPQGVSPYGVQDMIGNVWEWCFDWYNENEYKERAGKEVKDPRGAQTGSARVVRGGSWNLNRYFARCSFRYWNVPVYFNYDLGFRVVCSPSFKTL